jgi:two-component system chemotaxis response regulator CheB
VTRQPVRAIVVGASAGAVQALSAILPRLPATFRIPLLIVVHVPDVPSGLVALFKSKCAVPVREPEDKEPIVPGTAYFAPPGYHLLVEADARLALSVDAPVLFSRPAVDILFETAADVFGAHLLGIVLTGANEDGARGARAIAAAGGRVIVQDPATAFAQAMPRAALAHCPTTQTLSLEDIADHLAALGEE